MFEHSIKVRVRYAETDQMGVVYYGNYATYLEVARVEAFRFLGVSYKELEDQGIMLPVVEYQTRYIKPAKYDDLLTVKVSIKKIPSAKITFHYEIYNEEHVLLNTAETLLVFISKDSGKIVPAPTELIEGMKKYFTKVSEEN